MDTKYQIFRDNANNPPRTSRPRDSLWSDTWNVQLSNKRFKYFNFNTTRAAFLPKQNFMLSDFERPNPGQVREERARNRCGRGANTLARGRARARAHGKGAGSRREGRKAGGREGERGGGGDFSPRAYRSAFRVRDGTTGNGALRRPGPPSPSVAGSRATHRDAVAVANGRTDERTIDFMAASTALLSSRRRVHVFGGPVHRSRPQARFLSRGTAPRSGRVSGF